jgi:LysM repeat protein
MKSGMNRVKYLFILILISITASAFQEKEYEIKKVNGKNFYVYKVEKGDGWFSIARKFNITYPELRLANKESDDKLVIGKIIYVPAEKLKPTDPYFDKKYPDAKSKKKDKLEKADYHIVTKSQTLFSLSKIYNVPVDSIKKWNKLKSNSIHPGQKLLMKNISAGAADINIPPSKPAEVKGNEPVLSEPPGKPADPNLYTPSKTRTDSVVDPEQLEVITNEPPVIPNKEENTPRKGDSTFVINDENVVFSNGRKETKENGLAGLTDDDGDNTEKYFAFHRTAPVGTVIRVLSLSNSRKIYVKVTGTLQESEENDDLIIRISKAAADKLNISEKKFKVNLLYGTSE